MPLWLIPPVVAAVALWQHFTAPLAVLGAIFALDAFVLLPLLSRRHACRECPQRAGCPWMAADSKTG